LVQKNYIWIKKKIKRDEQLDGYYANARFLICFIALVIARIVEIRLNNKYTKVSIR